MTYCGSWILVNSYPFSAARVINVIRRSGSSPHRNWHIEESTKKNQIEKDAFLEHHVTISVPNFVYLRRFWAIFRRPNIGSFSARGLFTATCYALCRVPSFVDQKNYYVHIVVTSVKCNSSFPCFARFFILYTTSVCFSLEFSLWC